MRLLVPLADQHSFFSMSYSQRALGQGERLLSIQCRRRILPSARISLRLSSKMDTSHAIQRHWKSNLPRPQVCPPIQSHTPLPLPQLLPCHRANDYRVLYFVGGETDTPKIPSANIKKAKRKVASASKEAKEAGTAIANEAQEGIKKRTKKVVE